jgi:acetylornithine deacetylase
VPIDPLRFARQLIDVPSPTESEFDVAVLLDTELTRLGFATERQEVTANRFNLYASAGGRPRVVMNSHLDTVPPWFASYEDETHIYGRGACDTKGIIAAMIAAGERLRARNVTDFAFLFVVGEETDSIGAKQANEHYRDLGSEYCVVGEPTESTFARASKGAMTAVVRFNGKAAHSAYPHLGDSAITKMAAAIAEINATSWGSHEVLGDATANVGVVRGGFKPNIIPAEAEAEMMFRVVGELETARRQLETLVAKYDGEITMTRGNPPQMMTVPEGQPSAVVSFNTDVPWLGNLGKPLLFGPGSILDAHGAKERIAKQDLLDAVTTYEEMVVALLEGRVG